MKSAIHFSSPKRRKHAQTGWEGFFPYYAGFPESFVTSVIKQLELRDGALILDPWNGSGTTTYTARSSGFNALGFDLNPAMVVIAKARLLHPTEADSIEPLGKEILREALQSVVPIEPEDALRQWFEPETAATLRSIETSIRRHLLGSRTLAQDGVHLEHISSLAAANYVALFSVCREFTQRFQSSNPTWLKVATSEKTKGRRSAESIKKAYLSRLHTMASALAKIQHDFLDESSRIEIRVADSTVVGIEPQSVDLMLTSPPYCTRIDYTAATRIELAVLDPLLTSSVRTLGAQMIGSVQVPSQAAEVSEEWGTTCEDFLNRVQNHSSKASKTYYYKTHVDYFEKLFRSIANLTPCIKPDGSAVFVVQDSYYKDVHNDLATITTEMANGVGLKLTARRDFHLQQSMSGVNTKTRTYRKPNGATESVLLFERA